MLRSRLAISALVASALCFGPVTPVYAQTDAEKQEAAKLYKEGIEAYFGADYAVAITKFREGFGLDPNAMFLYNLSLCFSKLGNPAEALEHAERAAEMGGMPDEAETKNKARLVAFTSLVQSEEMADNLAAEPEVPTCATNADCSEGEVCNLRRGVCVEEIPGGTDPKPGDPLFSPIGWAGVGVGGLGLVLLGAGGIVSLQVAGLQDEWEQLVDDNDPAAGTKLDELESKKSAGRILVLGGIGATVIGAGLVVVDLFVLKDKESDSASTLAPYIAPGEAGFSWSLQF